MWGSCRSIVNGGEEKPPVVIGVNAVNEGSIWVSHCPVVTTVGEEPPIVEADKKLERGHQKKCELYTYRAKSRTYVDDTMYISE